MKNRRLQRGNIFTVLLGGVVLSGSLAIALYQLMGGPIFSTVKLAKQTAAEAQTQTVARMIIAHAVNNQAVNGTTNIAGDCDADGSVEPAAWRTPGAVAHPTNGGLVPLTIGAPVTDPWSTEYGYCVWDVGSWNNPAVDKGCGAAVNRLKGSTAPTTDSASLQTVLTVISAGPDKTFQTTCYNYSTSTNDATNSTTNLVQTSPGTSDDIVTRYTYAEAAQATSSLWSLKTGATSIATIAKDLSVGDDATKGGITASSTAGALTTTGKIVAGGALKLGNDTDVTVCDPGHAGLMRYNAATYKAQFCNGTTWSDISAGGGGGGGGGSVGIKDLLIAPALTVPDGYSNYATKYYLGIGQNALPAVTGTTGYNTIIQSHAPIAKQQLGNLTFTSATGVSYALNGANAPAAGGTIIVEVNGVSNNTTAAGAAFINDGFVVTDTTANSVSGSDGLAASTSHTYMVAASQIGCASTNGAAAIFYYTYTGAPGNTTITVKPTTNASVNFTVSEYANIGSSATAHGGAGSTVDRYGGTTSTVGTITAQTATANTGTDSGAPGKLLVSVLGQCGYTAGGTMITANNATSYPIGTENPSVGPGWPAIVSADYSETSTVTVLPKYSSGAGVHQITTGVMASNPAHVWGFSAYNNNQKGAVSVIASFVPSTNATGPVYETGAGYGALQHATSGAFNTALGYNALTALTTGTYNTALGAAALATTTTGSVNNLAVGAGALGGTTTGSYNIGIGSGALATNTTGGYNTAIGAQTLNTINVLNDATTNQEAIGYQALAQKTILNRDTAFGYQAFYNKLTGNAVMGLGYKAGFNGNVQAAAAFGYKAAMTYTSGFFTAFGALAGTNLTATPAAFGYNSSSGTGNGAAFNLSFGANTYAGTGARATAFGYGALGVQTTGAENTAFGYNTLAAVTTGGTNTATGYSALAANIAGVGNTAVGYSAASGGTTPSAVTAFGSQALVSDNALGETGVGYKALNANNGFSTTITTIGNSGGTIQLTVFTTGFTTGDVVDIEGCATAAVNGTWTITVSSATVALLQGSTWVGGYTCGSPATMTRKGGNTAFGYNALAATTSGRNTAYGASALEANTTGIDNTAIGYQALASNTVGNYNTAAGYQALTSNSAGTTGSTAPAVVQASTLTATPAYATSSSTSFSTLPTAGNTVIVMVACNEYGGATCPTATVTDNQGGSYSLAARNSTPPFFGTFIYYRSNISPPSGTFTVTATPDAPFAGGSITTAAIEASGLAKAGPVDQTGTGTTGSGATSVSAVSGTTMQANELAVGAMQTQNYSNCCGGTTNAHITVVGAGWVQDAAWQNDAPGSTSTPASMSHKILSSTGTATAAWTYDSADPYGNDGIAVVATFKGAGTGSNGDYGERNTAVGLQALAANSSGDDNTAVGDNALLSNMTGSNNTGMGYQALMTNATGSENTAFGYQALLGSGMTGGYNTAAGYQALAANTTGSYNSASGYRALYANTTGSNNTAYGSNALLASITDSGSTAVGYNTLKLSNIGNATTYNTAVGDSALAALVTDTGNTAVGYQALKVAAKGTTATYNTALGYNALLANTTGVGNTAVGTSALAVVTTGTYNTAVGYGAGPSAGNGTLTNTTAIGYNAAVTANHSIRFGDTNIANSGSPPYGVSGQVAWSNPSDRRLKKDIKDTDLGLDFIMNLRPVSYRLLNSGGGPDYGFIAQEVEKALGERITSMIRREANAMKSYLLRAADLLAPVVRAIQEQQAVEEKQRLQIDALKARLEKVKAEMKELNKEAAP